MEWRAKKGSGEHKRGERGWREMGREKGWKEAEGDKGKEGNRGYKRG